MFEIPHEQEIKLFESGSLRVFSTGFDAEYCGVPFRITGPGEDGKAVYRSCLAVLEDGRLAWKIPDGQGCQRDCDTGSLPGDLLSEMTDAVAEYGCLYAYTEEDCAGGIRGAEKGLSKALYQLVRECRAGMDYYAARLDRISVMLCGGELADTEDKEIVND